MIDPWKATHFGNGFAGEFLPAGERNWRYVKSGGQVIEFRSREDAKEAAKQAYLARYESPIHSTNERSPEEEADRMAAKLAAEAESFLISKRSDVKNATTQYRPGKAPLKVIKGRAPA